MSVTSHRKSSPFTVPVNAPLIADVSCGNSNKSAASWSNKTMSKASCSVAGKPSAIPGHAVALATPLHRTAPVLLPRDVSLPTTSTITRPFAAQRLPEVGASFVLCKLRCLKSAEANGHQHSSLLLLGRNDVFHHSSPYIRLTAALLSPQSNVNIGRFSKNTTASRRGGTLEHRKSDGSLVA